jgi:hypothetical protein
MHLMKFRKKTMINLIQKLRGDESGLAAVEFAVSLPFFLGLTVAAMETANYANTVMQLNQIAIHTADSAARMGEGNQLAVKSIKELHVNDVFAGMYREGESLDLDANHAFTDASNNTTLRGNAKIYLSSIERVADASWNSAAPRYRMRWQRCAGLGNFMTSTYGKPSTVTSVTAFGPTGRQVVPPDDGAFMFIELHYWFKPVIVNGFSRLTDHKISIYGSMVVRDQRNMRRGTTEESTPLQNPENVPVSSCPST